MQPVENHIQEELPYLLISNDGVESAAMPLEKNNSMFVGSGSNCRILLQGDDVDSIHCMFWINDDGILRIQDWNTGGKTIVNGQSVATETVLNSGDKVEICGYSIVPVLSQEAHERLAPQHPQNSVSVETDPSGDDQSTLAEEPQVPCAGRTAETEIEVENQPLSQDVDAVVETTHSEPAFSAPASDSAQNPSWENELPDEFGDPFALPGLESPLGLDDARDDEMELLRMEVEQLRSELAQREQFQGEIDLESGWESESEPIDEDQTIQLVNRLEDLLKELQTSDDRVRELEELLHFSDQAAQAEKEERQQLESWVTEIEQRVSQREAEAEAEMSRVLNRLKEAQNQYRQVETQLKQVLQSNGTNLAEESKELLQESRNQILELQHKLEELSEENEQLRQQSQSTEGEAKAKEELLQLEQKLLEVEVETSRERAEIARQRVELESLKDEFEQKLNSAKTAGDADSRVAAMRQHLRDIHEEEKIEREEKRQRSLSGRISRLLTRVGS